MSELCQASFNYLNDDSSGDDDRTNAIPMSVANGREANLPGWQVCGFELMTHVSDVKDWHDDEAISQTHYPELSSLAKAMTGCDIALVNSHIKRGPEPGKVHEDLTPITFVHSDFADSYGELLRRRYLEEDLRASLTGLGVTPDDIRNASRIMVFQFWRNIGERKMDFPIAFCDARTVSRQQLRPFLVEDYAGSKINFETLGIVHSAQHQWYSFPEMGIDEMIVFRTFDSKLVGTDQPYWTPHSAYQDPDVGVGAPPRNSIELRATCFFK